MESESKRPKIMTKEDDLWGTNGPDNLMKYWRQCMQLSDPPVFSKLLGFHDRDLLCAYEVYCTQEQRIKLSVFLETLVSLIPWFRNGDYPDLIEAVVHAHVYLNYPELKTWLAIFDTEKINSWLLNWDWSMPLDDETVAAKRLTLPINPSSSKATLLLLDEVLGLGDEDRIMFWELQTRCPKFFIKFYNEYLRQMNGKMVDLSIL
jgi:hypothetical protein